MKVEQHEIKETKKSYLRKNKKNGYYLEFELKNKILLSYEPFKIISFCNEDKKILEAYLFEKDNKIIVVISQINDLNYSKILFLNHGDDILLKIKECIENDKGKDIIRLSHTTEDSFIKILDIIFDKKEKTLIRK